MYAPKLVCLLPWDLGFFKILARQHFLLCMTYDPFSYLADAPVSFRINYGYGGVPSEHRRAHLSSGDTYQANSPIGLDSELLKRALKRPPKTPSEWSLERSPGVLALGHLRGQFPLL